MENTQYSADCLSWLMNGSAGQLNGKKAGAFDAVDGLAADVTFPGHCRSTPNATRLTVSTVHQRFQAVR
jgi:hypothetical protein